MKIESEYNGIQHGEHMNKILRITSRWMWKSISTDIEQSVVPNLKLSELKSHRPDGILEDVIRNHSDELGFRSCRMSPPPYVEMKWITLPEVGHLPVAVN
jgi:hypothetical protein